MVIQTSLLPEEKIFEANTMARAQWKTGNVWVQRVVAILVNKINPSDVKFKPAEISLHEITGDSIGGKQYTLVRNIINDLVNQSVILQVPGTKDDLIWHYVFESGARLFTQRNTLKICLNPALAPFYLELKKNFVAYGLTEFLSLPGTYHQSLYKYLKSWESEPEHTADIIELHRVLNSLDFHKKNYGKFDEKILKPAHKFINERTSLKYDYEPQKAGRKVVSVIFTFKSKPKFRKAPQPIAGAAKKKKS